MASITRIGSNVARAGLAWLLTCSVGITPLLASPPSADGLSPESAALVKRALDDELTVTSQSNGREVWQAVLGSKLFESGSAGPFDVFVLVEDGLSSRREAKALLADVLETLQPAAAEIERLWPQGGAGLVSTARLPVVIAKSRPGQDGFGELVSLLDDCERLGFSGWHPANQVDTSINRGAEIVRTWDVQLFNMAHPTIADRTKAWVDHGVGYYSLAFVANRALRRGAWGMVPPWLANGLIDELDIAAYGQAYVGQESWTRQTPGWFRAGWSGFVPTGHKPPPPVTGPPANLAVTVMKTGDPWLDFDASQTRHWSELVADRKSEAPASFARAAEAESFLPRDRAASRCLLHLMITIGTDGRESFTSLLDREVNTPRDGMPDSDALTTLFARALGGVPEVDRLEQLDTRSLLTELGRTDLISFFEKHGAAETLAMNDHREQSRWLGRKSYDARIRGLLFNAFLEVEFEQQLAEWKAISSRLDGAMAAALAESKSYPRRDLDRADVVSAFWKAVGEGPVVGDEKQSGSRSSKKSRSNRR